MRAIYDLATGGAGWAVMHQQVAERELAHLERGHWQTEATSYTGRLEPIFRDHGHGTDELVVATSLAIARVFIEGGEVYVTSAAKTSADASRMLAVLREEITATPLDEEGRRPVTFWTYGMHGPQSNTRRIDVPVWEQIRDNYGTDEAVALDELMGESFRPASGGQLLLWQGEAGTGKTWALRALVWEWRAWADFHYIVDPDQFFGEQASYLTTVLFHEDSGEPMPWREGERAPTPEVPKDRWKVLILEDSGELLSADAKERVGQALSRLLNVVDGLIGQGLRVLVLVTTNEPVKKLHEAVARPGRCAAKVEFGPLDYEHAAAWREKRGLELVAGGAASLAELYALLEGRAAERREPVGFTL